MLIILRGWFTRVTFASFIIALGSMGLTSGAHAGSWQRVAEAAFENGWLTADVSAPGTTAERWRFEANTPSGGALVIEYDRASGAATYSDFEWSGGFGASGQGWMQGVGGEFFAFYSDSWENESDPYFDPRDNMVQSDPHSQTARKSQAERELAALLQEIAHQNQNMPTTYWACVGSVAATVGATIAGVSQHSTQARARRMNLISRGRLAASVSAAGLIIGGAALVTATVCLPELF